MSAFFQHANLTVVNYKLYNIKFSECYVLAMTIASAFGDVDYACP